MGGVKGAETIRAFVALDLDVKSVRRVVRVADRLRMASGAPSATWTPQGNVHLTLKFMADLPAVAVAPFAKALALLVDAKKAPEPGTCRLQAFPSVEQANVIVIELADPRGDLSKLATKIDKLGSRHGVARESRAFVPHVTLASLGRPGTMHAGATIPVMRISSVLSESTVYPRHPELRDLRSSAIWPFLALALVVLLALVRSIWVIPGRRRRLPGQAGVPGSGGRNS